MEKKENQGESIAVAADVNHEKDQDVVNDSSKALSVPNISDNSPEQKALTATQQQFCLINIDGKIWLNDRTTLNALTDQGTVEKLKLSSRIDGKLLVKRFLRERFPKVDANKVFEEFLVSSRTVVYVGVEFNPNGNSGKYLNLWVGPTAEPKQGNWSQIKQFLLEIICAGVQEHYEYLVRYIAHALQKPGEKPGVMIVLKGGQGIGKGTLGRIFKRIWGATYIHVHNIKSVTGNFNASLERTFVVFLDEALFIGDKKAADALKSLVTEEYIHVEEKYQPGRQIRSHHRFIAATNSEFFKKTDRDDRRDFILRVSESLKNDHAFWEGLNNEIDGGGVKAMVYDLLAMDLSGFNVRKKPNTKEFLKEKLNSLGPIGQWWHDCLMRGAINEDDGWWPEFLSSKYALKEIKEFSGGRALQHNNLLSVAQEIKKICPSVDNTQRQKNGVRRRGLSLPSIQKARADFEEYLNDSIDWPDPLPPDNYKLNIQSGEMPENDQRQKGVVDDDDF